MTSKTRTYSNRLLYKGHHYRFQHSIGGLLIAADPKDHFQILTTHTIVLRPTLHVSCLHILVLSS